MYCLRDPLFWIIIWHRNGISLLWINEVRRPLCSAGLLIIHFFLGLCIVLKTLCPTPPEDHHISPSLLMPPYWLHFCIYFIFLISISPWSLIIFSPFSFICAHLSLPCFKFFFFKVILADICLSLGEGGIFLYPCFPWYGYWLSLSFNQHPFCNLRHPNLTCLARASLFPHSLSNSVL